MLPCVCVSETFDLFPLFWYACYAMEAAEPTKLVTA
jgi:hypothetical protein